MRECVMVGRDLYSIVNTDNAAEVEKTIELIKSNIALLKQLHPNSQSEFEELRAALSQLNKSLLRLQAAKTNEREF